MTNIKGCLITTLSFGQQLLEGFLLVGFLRSNKDAVLPSQRTPIVRLTHEQRIQKAK